MTALNPTQRLVGLLAVERRAGHSFDLAWGNATTRALAEVRPQSRELWSEVFAYAEEAMRRAYLGLPHRAMDRLHPPDSETAPPPAVRAQLLA